MKPLIAVLVLASMLCGQEKQKNSRQVALPSPSLLRCNAAQLWQSGTASTGAAYPVKVMMDHFGVNGCPQGIVAIYGATVSEDDIRSAINLRYGKWSRTDIGAGSVTLWRVDPDKFVIQLSTIHNSIEETGALDNGGMKQVIYLSFQGR